MSTREVEPHGPRPVAMGCTLVVVAIVLAVVAVGSCIEFAESGADSGKVTLRDADSYEFNSFEFIGERKFFLTRTPEGRFYAFSNLDAANRASTAGQCRIAVIASVDPLYGRLVQQVQSRFSADAGSSRVIFREGCHEAAYDIAGVRLDGDGRNLDSYPVSLDAQHRIVVDIRKRTCTERQGPQVRVAAAC